MEMVRAFGIAQGERVMECLRGETSRHRTSRWFTLDYFFLINHFWCSIYKVSRALLEYKGEIVGAIGTSHSSIAPGSLLALCSGIDVI